VREEYSYAPPGRPPQRIALDEWAFRKRLGVTGRDDGPTSSGPTTGTGVGG
jgi:hypothetical protein